MPNVPIRRLVNELSIRCINEKCSKVIKKGDLLKHLNKCDYQLINCPNSDSWGLIERKDIKMHQREKCPFRVVSCKLRCGISLPFNQMKDHINKDCIKEMVKCKNKCGKFFERGLIEKHLRKNCPFEIINCPNHGKLMFEEGCSVRIRRCEMDEHAQNCEYRKVMCTNKNWGSWVTYRNLPHHDQNCEFKIVNWKNNCGVIWERRDLQKHYDICKLEPIKCTYYEFGWIHEIIRQDFKDHLCKFAYEHSLMFVEGQK